MAFPQDLRLLALPLEVRRNVHKELLCPDPERSLQLYHDRKGREAVFNTHPAILRVNKQSYAEAVDLLYENNIFEISLYTPVVNQCTGGKYPGRTPDPPPLLRMDDDEAIANKAVYDSKRRVRTNGIDLSKPGLIYPHCLQRMHHIKLLTGHCAIWGQAMGGNFFSHIGKLVLQILGDVLCTEPSTAKKKIFDFISIQDRKGLFPGGGVCIKNSMVVEMALLLKDLSKSRRVNVMETSDQVELRMVDIEKFVAESKEKPDGFDLQ